VQNIPDTQKQKVLDILKQKSSSDAYYTAWIRTGDINVLMRLRDWRPNGEVIAPLSIREQLKQEAIQELSHYQK
jgi:CRISPR-associated protein (TIGR03985 family)